ncbi:MAG TPA: apolipoprotein N-acyltransferase [Steroidobacteraceae bacterium]|nr:apolipoprotein N-acyltransferase [Steroidobacteraceae bacterium]
MQAGSPSIAGAGGAGVEAVAGVGAGAEAVAGNAHAGPVQAAERFPALVRPRLSAAAVARALVALAGGAALACAFAPLQLWPLAILAPALQMWLWEGASARAAAWSGFWFGAGTFGLGTCGLFVSIHGPGQAPAWLALGLVAALVGIMALYQALLGYLAVRLLPAQGAVRWLVGLPALWLLVEWWRGWFLSGFPWLSLGYSQTDTPLASFAPVLGVYGISALLLVGSGALVALVRARGRVRAWAAAALLLPWAIGAGLGRVAWTHPAGPPVSVAVLQGAVPEDIKWQEENVAPTEALYARLEQRALGARLIVWPESALTEPASYEVQYLGQIYSRARMHGSDVIMGILRVDEADRWYDSIMTLADRVSFYDKHHLVPFAEYFPVPAFIRSWLRLMNLPHSDFTAGPAVQPLIHAGGTLLAPSVCYEDAFGSAALPQLRQGAQLLVNVTNDAWFGHSWVRYQHFQIARMRAMEAARPLIRAGNDGVSALVGARGQVLEQAPQFRPWVLTGSVQPRAGLPPFARYGNDPIVLLGLLAAALAAGRRVLSSTRAARSRAGLSFSPFRASE